MTIGERIRFFRTKKGLSTREVAGLTGISQPVISKIENGNRKIDTDSLNKIAAALEISVDRLMGESASSIIRYGLKESGMTYKGLADKAGVPLFWLQNLDSLTPGDCGDDDMSYTWISKVAEVLDIPGSVLRAALARQEIPVYENPDKSTPEEDFGEITTLAASRSDDYDKSITAEEEIAVKAFLEAYRKSKQK